MIVGNNVMTSVRLKSTFFYIASSYINADILRPEYFEDEFEGNLEDVLTAILSSETEVGGGKQIRTAAVTSMNFYGDGTSSKYAAEFGIRDEEDCRILKYLRTHEPIEIGVDFGNMISISMGQETGEGLQGS